MNRLIYLAGPIDRAGKGGKAIREQRALLTDMLRERGMSVYDPAEAFAIGEGSMPSEFVYQINTEALSRASGMVALLPDGVPSIGTPMEIEQALSVHRIPVAVLGGGGSWHLAEKRGGMLRVFGGAEWEAADWMEQVARGRKDGKRAMPFTGQREAAGLPGRAIAGDAGFDLPVSEDVVVEAGTFVDIPTGLSVELPRGAWGLIVGRSSTLRRRGLLVALGVIDNGYRGPLYAGVWNLRDEPVEVKRGERLAQLIPIPLVEGLVPMWVAELSLSERGNAGFGSTGD